MTTFFGAIADDFTGATDLAAMIARSGTPVSLRLGVPETPPTQSNGVEVIALKCRSTPVAEAVSETTLALDWLKEAGAQHLFWKYCSTFDSTPQGNIGPVAEALMHAMGTDRTIHVPAFPENGRSVYQGVLFVGDQPLAESPMKDHPLNPMRDSNLLRLLAPQTSGAGHLIPWSHVAEGPASVRASLDTIAGPGLHHVVIDTVADGDLGVIAHAAAHLPLSCGGSAIAGALAQVYLDEGALPHQDDAATQAPKGGQLVLSGSCSAMTRTQVAAFAKAAPAHRLDPQRLAEGPDALEAARTWLRAQAPDQPKIIYATAEPEQVARAQAALGSKKAGALVEEALATLAQDALASGVTRVVVAGGETSGAVVKALNITTFDLGPEIAPGVPWCMASTAQGPIALALKSGNFGDEDFFTTAFAKLP
ncbi:MAG: 3-oxo-tetronate kinase [Pseudomonadota bacterium]